MATSEEAINSYSRMPRRRGKLDGSHISKAVAEHVSFVSRDANFLWEVSAKAKEPLNQLEQALTRRWISCSASVDVLESHPNSIRRTASKPDSISVVGKYGGESQPLIPNAFSSHCSSREIQTTNAALASCFTSISSAFATESLPITRSAGREREFRDLAETQPPRRRTAWRPLERPSLSPASSPTYQTRIVCSWS